MGRCKSGLTEISPLLCTTATWVQYPFLSHPEPRQGAPLGVAALADGLAAGSLSVSLLSSLRTHRRGVVADGLMAQHPLFADQAGNLFLSHLSPLLSELLSLAVPTWIPRAGKSRKYWLWGSASGTEIRGERYRGNVEGQRIFSTTVM